jgi:hypothetical protein
MTVGEDVLTRTARPWPAGIKLTGWALVLAPLLIIAGEVLHPPRSAVPAQQLAIVAQHPGAWYASHLLLFAGIVLTLPAVAGLVFLLGGRARRLAAVGAGLAVTGIVCFAGLLTIGFVVWQMASQDADRSQMAALFDRLFHAPGFIVPFEAAPLTFAVGMIILAVALDRTAIVPHWVTLSLGAGATGLSLVGIVPGAGYAIAASAVLVTGMVPIGKIILTSNASGASPARQ